MTALVNTQHNVGRIEEAGYRVEHDSMGEVRVPLTRPSGRPRPSGRSITSPFRANRLTPPSSALWLC